MDKKIVIVMPAFNEAAAIAKVIKSIQDEGYKNIVVVDDGSIDNTQQIAKAAGCHSIRHIINRGKGAATQTGFDAAKKLNADVVVTIDADGQHNPKEIASLVNPIINNEAEVTLGSRMIAKKVNMPLARKIINFVGNLITYFVYGIYVSDSQSGFRAYSAKANSIIYTYMDRYEFESEILQQIKRHGLSYKEVPITVRYTKHSMSKYDEIKDSIPDFRPQNFMNGFRMIFKMIINSII